jgi:hypothetical protein
MGRYTSADTDNRNVNESYANYEARIEALKLRILELERLVESLSQRPETGPKVLKSLSAALKLYTIPSRHRIGRA